MKKLYILGTHPHVDNVKFGQLNTIYWGVSPLLMSNGKYDNKLNMVFEIHRKDEYIQDTAEYIYKTDIPVMMQKKDKKVKNCLIYPFKEYLKKYGDYVTNSITLMLWHAVESGYKDIVIAGVEFLNNREGMIERPNLEYWIGYFRAKGIKIEVPKESFLLKTKYVYGIDNILLNIKRHEERLNELYKFIDRYYDEYLDNIKDYIENKISKEDYQTKEKEIIEKIRQARIAVDENEILLRMI